MLEKNEETLADLREQKKRFDELYGGAGELNKQIREARQSAINCRVVVDRMTEDYRNAFPAEYWSKIGVYEEEYEDE